MLAYFECFSGVAGDMILAALVDAGLGLDRLRTELAGLELSGYRLESWQHEDQNLRGRRLEVVVEARDGTKRLGDLVELVERSALPGKVVARATAVLRRIGQAWAAVSGAAAEDFVLNAGEAT